MTEYANQIADKIDHGSITDDDWRGIVRAIERAKNYTQCSSGAQIIEVGTLSAKTTIGILHICRAFSLAHFVLTIDKDPSSKYHVDKIQSAMVGFYCGTADDYFHYFDVVDAVPPSVFFAFIDGCHCEQCVASDLLAILPHVTFHGTVALHDADDQHERGMLVHQRYHGDGVSRPYGVTEAIKKSKLLNDSFELIDFVKARPRPEGPTPIFGGLQVWQRMR